MRFAGCKLATAFIESYLMRIRQPVRAWPRPSGRHLIVLDRRSTVAGTIEQQKGGDNSSRLQCRAEARRYKHRRLLGGIKLSQHVDKSCAVL